MFLKKFIWILAILILLAGAGYARREAFWAVHDDPVETAYTVLAMKMGTHPALSAYHPGGTTIRRRDIPEMGEGGRMIPAIAPIESDTAAPASFDAWPSETNPFYFKPPIFSALMVFCHHQSLGAHSPFYTLLSAEPKPPKPGVRSAAVIELQSWAVMTPYLSGLVVILLTFILGWMLSGPGAGLLAAALTAAHPYQAHASTHVWPEATLTAFLLLSVALLKFSLSRQSWSGCFASGIAFALAVLTDHSALFVLPVLWVWTVADCGGPTRSMRGRIFNPFIVAFAVGTLLIIKPWIYYVGHAFSQPIWSRASFEVSGVARAALEWARSGAAFVIVCPPILAALRPQAKVTFLAFIALSLIVGRWAYYPQAPWDERAWIAVVPFAALAAAPTLLTVFRHILFKAKTA